MRIPAQQPRASRIPSPSRHASHGASAPAGSAVRLQSVPGRRARSSPSLAALKFFTLFEQGAPRFHLALGSANHVANSASDVKTALWGAARLGDSDPGCAPRGGPSG